MCRPPRRLPPAIRQPRRVTRASCLVAPSYCAHDGTIRASSAPVRFEQQTGNVLAVRPVTPENPIPRRTRGVAPVRPSRFADVHVVISPLVTLDRNGTVTSVARDACYLPSGGAHYQGRRV